MSSLYSIDLSLIKNRNTVFEQPDEDNTGNIEPSNPNYQAPINDTEATKSEIQDENENQEETSNDHGVESNVKGWKKLKADRKVCLLN